MEKINIDISNVTFPAIATSGDSSLPRYRFIKVAETFSERYRGKLPNRFLLELAAVYLSANGKYMGDIRRLNRVIVDLCEFSVAHGLRSETLFFTLIRVPQRHHCHSKKFVSTGFLIAFFMRETEYHGPIFQAIVGNLGAVCCPSGFPHESQVRRYPQHYALTETQAEICCKISP